MNFSEHNAKAVRLTEAGRVFLFEARAVLERVAAAVQTARAVSCGKQGELHLGYSRSEYPEYDEWLASLFVPLSPPVLAEEHDSSTSLIAAVKRANMA